MAELHFEFVSPETILFSGDVDQVDLPGAEGDMGILAGHAPLVTALRPGIVTTVPFALVCSCPSASASVRTGAHSRSCPSRRPSQ